MYGIVRELQQDTGIAGHLIPKGAALIDVIFFYIYRSQEFWKDPEVFDPLRFHPDDIDHQHSYAYHVFHSLQVGLAGNCIGQNFAMNEERVVIASIIEKFRFSLMDGYEIKMSPSVLLGFKDDIKLCVEIHLSGRSITMIINNRFLL